MKNNMDKNLLDFKGRKTNVYIVGNFMKQREVKADGWEFYTETIINLLDRSKDEVWHTYWINPNEKKPTKNKPKHTGGKKSYSMLMTEELKATIEKLKENGVKNAEEVLGYMFILTEHSEFNTNKLIHKRNKKPLQYKDLQEIFNCSNNKLNKMLKILKDNDLLSNTNEGYFISQEFIKKGKSKKKGVIEDDR